MVLGECAERDDDDRWQVAMMLESMLPRHVDPQPWEARLRRFTRTLVQRYRDKIEAVAVALLERHTLSAAKVEESWAGQLGWKVAE